MFRLKKEKVQIDQEIGQGSFGAVFPYQVSTQKETKKEVVKIMATKKIPEFIEKHLKEIVLSFSFDHPNVISANGFHVEFDAENELYRTYLKLPRMEKSLKILMRQNLHRKTPLPEENIARYFYALIRGLLYLHQRGIAHRDIKPANILIDNNGQIKLADYGVANLVGDDTSSSVEERAGTLRYSAPEILNETSKLKKKDLFRADCWSLGVVMLELCILLPPDCFDPQTELDKNLEQLKKREYSEVLKNLISRLLQRNPSERISLEDVKKELEEQYFSLLKEEREDDNNNELLEKLMELKKRGYSELLGKFIFVLSQFDPKENSLKDIERELDNKYFSLFKKLNEEIDLKKTYTEPDLKRFKDYFETRINLKKGSLKIHRNMDNITDEILKDFMEEIAQQQNQIPLKEFEIDLIDCLQISNNGVRHLAQSMGLNSKTIQKVKISLGAPRRRKEVTVIDDEGINTLSRQIGSNLNIQQLSLDFGNIDISDSGVEELSQQIGKNLSKIQELKLSFPRCSKITDNGVKELAQGLSLNEKNIRKFGINFNWCNGITDHGIKELAKKIGLDLKNIESLELHFGGCYKITDDGIKELALKIGSNRKIIKELILSFWLCDEITDDGIKEVAKKIGSNLEKIEKLDLLFWGCPYITDDSLKEIAQQFNSTRSLQELDIDFMKCNVTSQARDNFKNSCYFIPKLKVVL